MSDLNPIQNATAEGEQDPPLIDTIYTGECPSLSGRSTLTFAIGRHAEDASLHLKIVSNDGGGMFYDGWANEQQIDGIVNGATELTSKSFQALHPGRSVNTAGFVLASLKHLGLIRTNPENTRLHEQVPTVTFKQAVIACTGPEEGSKSSKRKPKGA